MKYHALRFKFALKAASIHFIIGLLIATIFASFLFNTWYPYPYSELAGGKELFILVISIDIICGPLLTFVIFSPTKCKKEMLNDIILIIAIQLAALSYGFWNIWQVRPLFLVHDADRFNIISKTNIDTKDIDFLPKDLQPKLFGAPIKVSLRNITAPEQEKLNFQIKSGGKDASELPLFYSRFHATKAYESGHELRELLITQPQHKSKITDLIEKSNTGMRLKMRYLYIVGRHYQIVILDESGNFIEYLKVK